MNDHTEISIRTAAPVFPPRYAMRLNAPHGAGEYEHGDLIICDTAQEPAAGDLACVHPRSGGSVMVVLDLSLPPGTWKMMPYREAHESESRAALIGKILGTSRRVAFECQDLWAIHKCDGKADPARCVG